MVALGLVGLWPLGLAAAVGAPEAVAPAELPSLGFSVLRLIGALGFVLALFFGGIWLVRNWRRLAHRPSASSELRLLEVRSLGARQALWLVGYHRQRLLVASSPAGVTLVAALPEAEAEAPAPPVGSDFSAVFQQLLHRAS